MQSILPVRTISFDTMPTTNPLCNCQRTVSVKCKRLKAKGFPLYSSLFTSHQIGGGERVRTDDPLRARQVLSQLSYTPNYHGGPGWTRTIDLTIISRVL